MKKLLTLTFIVIVSLSLSFAHNTKSKTASKKDACCMTKTSEAKMDEHCKGKACCKDEKSEAKNETKSNKNEKTKLASKELKEKDAK